MSFQGKKTIILSILNILERYTDDSHTLSQKRIGELLEAEGISVDRKTIKRNLEELLDLGYDIQYRLKERQTTNAKTGEKIDSSIWTDIHLIRDFTDSELRLIITSLMAARNIPYTQGKELIQKVEGLSSEYFHKQTNLSAPVANSSNLNQELFGTIEIIEEAIREDRQISMNYADFQTDKKLHLRISSQEWNFGEPVKYIISPYYIITNNARLYLIGSSKSKGEWHLSFYRLDRIKGISLLDKPRFPKEQVEGIGPHFELSEFTKEHLYMQYSESIRVTFRIKKWLLGELFDMFTGDVTFSDETENEVTVNTKVSYMSMKSWATQFCEHVLVLSPERLADDIQKSLETAVQQYKDKSLK